MAEKEITRATPRNWSALCSKVGMSPKHDPLMNYSIIAEQYSEPHRKYHNLSHIDSCLEDFEKLKTIAEHPETIELAIWLHDLVYDVPINSKEKRKFNNEKQSASLAYKLCAQAGMTMGIPKRVYDLILLTNHDGREVINLDEKILLDADLAVLGKSLETYKEYSDGIRQEFSGFSDAEFKEGRCGFLNNILNRKRIFHTDSFEKQYGYAARANMVNELKGL